jgi:Protein of unknown function (DUF2852)
MMSQTSNANGYGRRGRCGALGWRPLELVAMVLGFVVFWPIGLAVLLMKGWQARSGHQGDLASFAQERAEWARGRCRGWRGGEWADRGTWGARSSGGGWGMRPTGNSAFDEWRAAELARLEEERRKLEEAERDFAAHIDELRRARDREEFERFMDARRARGPNREPPAA